MIERTSRCFAKLAVVLIPVVMLGSFGSGQGSCPVDAWCTGAAWFKATPVTDADSYGPEPLPFPVSVALEVPQFDPAVYAALHGVLLNEIELVAVELELVCTVDTATIEVRNDHPTESCGGQWQYALIVLLEANATIGSPACQAVVDLNGNTGTLGPGEVYNYSLPSPVADTDCLSWRVQDGNLSAGWIGTGSVVFATDSAAATSNTLGCSVFTLQYSNSASASVEVTYHYCVAAFPSGTEFCTGHSGSGTQCPCNNDNDGSVPGAGCANGQHPSGALLNGTGDASLSSDTLVLHAQFTEADQFGLYFQGENDLSPGLPWGDGLRCVGGDLQRIGTLQADPWGSSDTSGLTNPISVIAGNISAGDTKHYQLWYRTPTSSLCGSYFNSTNGYRIVWSP